MASRFYNAKSQVVVAACPQSAARSWASNAHVAPFCGCGGLSFGLFQNHLDQLFVGDAQPRK
jgi:hypothetical protein